MVSRVLARSLALAASLTLLAAACSSSDDAALSEEDAVQDGAIDSSTGSGDGGSDDGAAAPARPDTADPASFDAEPVGSALRGDRDNPGFPDPLIDPDDIQSGGPPPDGIPPIDSPVFALVSDTDYLSDQEGVVVVEINGDARAYPIQVLIWHEIVNDTVGDEPVTVTFCPLCNSALVFKRQFGSRLLDFGTSGELYQSALVMYDRQTESLWAHFTGEGVVGHYAGAQLELIPAQTLSYGDFAERYPDGQVLTTETGFTRSYGLNPYVGYDDEATDPIGAFISQDIDDRLPSKTRMVGVLAPSGPFSLTLADLTEDGVFHYEGAADGASVVVFHQSGLGSALDASEIDEGRDIGQTGAFMAEAEGGTVLTFTASGDGETFTDAETGSTWTVTGEAIAGDLKGQRLEAIPHLDTFWFAWSTYRPEAVLVQ